MSKYIPDDVMDVALSDIKDNANIVHGCSSQPVDYAGIASVSLGSVSVDSSDFTLGNGDSSGRKITLAEQSITWSSSGDCTHIVVADSVNSEIKAITTCPTKSVTASDTGLIGEVDLWEIRDPS